VPSLPDMERVIDQGIRVHIRFADLALTSVLAEKPVVGKRSGVLLARLSHHLGRVLLELLQLPLPDLQPCAYFELAHSLPPLQWVHCEHGPPGSVRADSWSRRDTDLSIQPHGHLLGDRSRTFGAPRRLPR